MSRNHAQITQDAGRWYAEAISARRTAPGPTIASSRRRSSVHDGDRIRFGHIAFYFVTDVSRLPEPVLGSRTLTATLKPSDMSRRTAANQALTATATTDREEEERTNVGLPDDARSGCTSRRAAAAG